MGEFTVRLFRALFLLSLLLSANFLAIGTSYASASQPGGSGDAYIFGADSPVFDDGMPQNNPALSGNMVVWSEYDTATRKARILFKDLAGGAGEPGRAIIENETAGGNPALSQSGRVVWSERMGSDLRVYYKDVDFANFQPCTASNYPAPAVDQCAMAVSPGYFWQENPAISPDGTKVAWENGNGHGSQIHLYDFNTGVDQEILSAPGHDQEYPSLDNEWVVWTEKWQFNSAGSPLSTAVYARMFSGEMVTVAKHESDGYHELSGARLGRNSQGEPVVVYLEYDKARLTTVKVLLYNLATGTVEDLSDSIQGRIHSPYIDGDKAVWLDYSKNARGDLVLYDLGTHVKQRVPKDAAMGASSPLVSASSKYIVWKAPWAGPGTIYYNRIGDTAQSLAERYRPDLRFTHDVLNPDRNDFEPRPVDLMADMPGAVLRTADGDIENPSLKGLAENPGPDNYLDLPGSPVFPGFFDYSFPYLSRLASFPDSYPVTAYGRVITNAESTEKTVIQYWLCYYFNNWINNHEGDWEMIEVILDRDLVPEAAAYSQHGKSFKKYWSEPGFEKLAVHPVAYVAEGSHANYFSEGIHYNIAGIGAFSDTAAKTSSVLPMVELEGLAAVDGWSGYAGHWGQQKGAWWQAWVGDGPPGPRFQPSIKDSSDQEWSPWEHPLSWAQASQEERAYANDMSFAVFSPADIHLYDFHGNHVGKNVEGGIDMQIPGSEYYEREEDHSKNIIVHNADLRGNYRLELNGTGTGTMDLKVQVPDFSGGVVDKSQYLSIPVSQATKAEMSVSSDKDYVLRIDSDGDGAFEEEKAPDRAEPLAVDFNPPSQVKDLSVTNVTSGSVSLAWTAPGDDGETGDPARYEIRYSTQPITEENWSYSKEAGMGAEPQTAGSTETMTVSGLDAGTAYYFAVRARDDVWQRGPLSNLAFSTTTVPRLTWSKLRAYWASWADYAERRLSVEYRLGNVGTGWAIGANVQASFANPESVYTVSSLPFAVDDLDAGSKKTLTLKYFVPNDVRTFTTRTFVTCNDDAGRVYWFPGPPA